MSEKLLEQGGEHLLAASETISRTFEKVSAETLKADGEAASRNQLEALIRAKEAAPISDENPLQKLEQADANAAAAARPRHVDAQLKNITLKREIKQIQRRLPVADRTLSKVIHQPAVRAVSEATAKTVSRPSGLLGGGLLAFVGTSAYLMFTRHIGLQYNYGIFIGLFIGGFIVGLVLEFIVWSLTSRHRTNP